MCQLARNLNHTKMIRENLDKIRAAIPEGVTLVAVSKYHPVEALREAYDAGQRIFGESRENELKTKVEALPADIEWHFIGHLQTNKVKYLAPIVSLIHSIDSERLLDEVERQAIRYEAGRKARFANCLPNSQLGDLSDGRIPVLLQLHVAQEESKSGFTPAELLELLAANQISERWPHVSIRGLMGMASFVDDEQQWRQEFRQITQCQKLLLEGALKQQGFTPDLFPILSFGMSDDHQVAIQEGSNMVRVGTAIFGSRQY